jgi:hypothetical protein
MPLAIGRAIARRGSILASPSMPGAATSSGTGIMTVDTMTRCT